ncbi:MAG: RNA methyltransferase [Sphingobacteriales bacterium]|nr:MAG: RNA methyltransferase [Sphingobacteriales bacterium]
MLSKAQNKYIRSLSQQKYRKESQVFVAEGDKIALEWLNADADIKMIVGVQEWISRHQGSINKHPEASLHIVEPHILESLSTLKTPNMVLLVVALPEPQQVNSFNWCLALDDIQDPGNMGTIIRIADWFGWGQIVCSPNCVDVYNPKVVQSAMGGHLRVNIITEDLSTYLSKADKPIFAAALEGTNIYQLTKPDSGILVIGNESKGISEPIMRLATQKITIVCILYDGITIVCILIV